MRERKRKVDLDQTKKKNEKKQLLAERSVEGTSRLGLVRVSWKSADVGCTGSAAMAPGSMLSTYVAKKDFLVAVPIPCPLLMSAMSCPLPAWACAVKLPGVQQNKNTSIWVDAAQSNPSQFKPRPR